MRIQRNVYVAEDRDLNETVLIGAANTAEAVNKFAAMDSRFTVLYSDDYIVIQYRNS